jgi:hypothetical protein
MCAPCPGTPRANSARSRRGSFPRGAAARSSPRASLICARGATARRLLPDGLRPQARVWALRRCPPKISFAGRHAPRPTPRRLPAGLWSSPARPPRRRSGRAGPEGRRVDAAPRARLKGARDDPCHRRLAGRRPPTRASSTRARDVEASCRRQRVAFSRARAVRPRARAPSASSRAARPRRWATASSRCFALQGPSTPRRAKRCLAQGRGRGGGRGALRSGLGPSGRSDDQTGRRGRDEDVCKTLPHDPATSYVKEAASVART